MSTFVLVHGAWHGSWCWKRVRQALRAEGHDVFTPTLTGVGERSHLLSPQIDLNTHINDIANCIQWEELADVILCGHSYGGCVIRGVADRIPDRIGALVYLDAFIPEVGQSLHDLLSPEMRAEQLDLARTMGDGWKVPPIPAEAFHVQAKDRDWVNRQCTYQSLETFRQPLHLTGAIEGVTNNMFILAGGWSPSPFAAFYEKAKANGWKTVTIDCGHDVMLDEPEELTRALLSVSAGRTS